MTDYIDQHRCNDCHIAAGWAISSLLFAALILI